MQVSITGHVTPANGQSRILRAALRVLSYLPLAASRGGGPLSVVTMKPNRAMLGICGHQADQNR